MNTTLANLGLFYGFGVFDDVIPQMDAVCEHLRSMDFMKIVLAGHGLGAAMAVGMRLRGTTPPLGRGSMASSRSPHLTLSRRPSAVAGSGSPRNPAIRRSISEPDRRWTTDGGRRTSRS